MKVVGLTGGVAGGKSTVAKCFSDAGVPVIDTDQIVRDLLTNDPTTQDEVRTLLGTLDRAEIRKIVFSDKEKRTQLEQLLHPKVNTQVQKQIEGLIDEPEPPSFVLVVVPLLFETGWEKRADFTIAVVSSEKDQLERLMKRDGIESGLAQQMIHSQLSNDEKRDRADYVIDNDASVEHLKTHAKEVLDDIRDAFS